MALKAVCLHWRDAIRYATVCSASSGRRHRVTHNGYRWIVTEVGA